MLILEIREPDGQVLRRELDLEDKALKVGRLDSCQIRLQHNSVSRLHALISREKKFFGGWSTVLTELGVGTTVNEQAVRDSTRLRPGDRIKVGDVEITVLST